METSDDNRRFTYRLQAWLDPAVLDANRIRRAAIKGGYVSTSEFVRRTLLTEVERLETTPDRKRRSSPKARVA